MINDAFNYDSLSNMVSIVHEFAFADAGEDISCVESIKTDSGSKPTHSKKLHVTAISKETMILFQFKWILLLIYYNLMSLSHLQCDW